MNSSFPEPPKMEKQQAVQATKMLVRAFWNYPLLVYFLPEETRRKTVAETILAIAVYSCMRYGEVHVSSDKLEGAAIWTSSLYYPPGIWRMLRSVPLRYIFGVASGGAAELQSADQFLNDIHKRLVPYPHWYLEILGVDPQYQKQGFSSRLVKPMLNKLEAARIPCFLETQDPLDVPIYQHFGFEIIDQSKIPDTPLISWAMLRKPTS